MVVTPVIRSTSQPKNTAKRKAGEVVDVPALTADPDERKRVLNVLAQRRYRERKREHVKKLEARIGGALPTVHRRKANAERPQPPSATADQVVNSSSASSAAHVMSLGPTTFCSSATICPSLIENTPPVDPRLPDVTDLISDSAWDTSVLLPSISGPSSPSLTRSSTSPTQSSHSSDSMPLAQFLDVPSPSALTIPRPHDLSSALQRDDVTHHSFADDRHLPILELNLSRGCLAIARRLNLDDLLWNFSAVSPFTDPKLQGMSFNHLPTNLRPSKIQLTIPHHPLFDILPWPTTRDNLISIFSLPEELRPPKAASSTAMVDLVMDFEDSAEGVRIWGDDPCCEQNWEIGEKMFESWWWSFDGRSVRNSNRWRRRRGAKLLGGGKIVGEVDGDYSTP